MAAAITPTHASNLRVQIENEFLFNAFFHLYGSEYTTIMYCVSLLDPFSKKTFEDQMVPATDLIKFLKSDADTKWGSAYEFLASLSDRLTERRILFRDGYDVIDKTTGKVYEVKGGINWFQYFLVLKDKQTGGVFLKFRFSEILKNFLLDLNEYLTMGILELDGMNSGHAKHLYSVLKSYRDKMRRHSPAVSKYLVECEELKKLLGLEGSYERFKDFHNYVIKKAVKEIKEAKKARIDVDYKTVREGRRVKYIEFLIWDKNKKLSPHTQDYIPTEDELGNLTYAQRLAYSQLVEFGVIEGIALKQLLPTIKGSEFIGFEDHFVRAALAHFRQWAKNQNPGVFVNWWLENRVFDTSSDVWSKIVEQVVAEKKKLQQADAEAFENRLIAKDMSYKEFVNWYRSAREH